jgi:PPM family protein phosphatase
MIQVFSHTEVGGHAHNEDAFDVSPHPSDSDCLLCALADGQGGRAGGARAAQLACRSCIEAASTYQPAILTMRPEAWEAILRQADAATSNDLEAGFTTLIAFTIKKESICGASNGDSGVYAVGAGEPAPFSRSCSTRTRPSGAAEPGQSASSHN